MLSEKQFLTILRGKDCCFTQFSTGMAGWLLLIFLICLRNQLSSTYSIISTRCLKNVVHQIDSKNRQLLFSAIFMAKFELAFVLKHQKMLFLRGFIFKPTERAQVLLKNGTRDFQNSLPFERSACFYVTINDR